MGDDNQMLSSALVESPPSQAMAHPLEPRGSNGRFLRPACQASRPPKTGQWSSDRTRKTGDLDCRSAGVAPHSVDAPIPTGDRNRNRPSTAATEKRGRPVRRRIFPHKSQVENLAKRSRATVNWQRRVNAALETGTVTAGNRRRYRRWEGCFAVQLYRSVLRFQMSETQCRPT